ncbi:MAG: HlyD family type I secretion periplasmic adaptor subunit [Pseudomonadota bacterium]
MSVINSQTDPSKPNIWLPTSIGLGIALLFIFGFLGWAIFSPLSSAAIAQGTVTVDLKRKTIQHLEGGIVQKILVRDGDEVTAGQLLFTLDKTQALANLELLNGRYLAALALQARLNAERDGLDQVSIPELFLTNGNQENNSQLITNQTSIFLARKNSLEEQTAILSKRIAQYEAELSGLSQLESSQNDEIALFEEEIKSNQNLYDEGLVPMSRLRTLQREMTELMGERSQNIANKAKIRQNISEVQLEINNLKTQQLNDVVEQLREVEESLYDFSQRRYAANDVLYRTEIKAPISGTIVNSQIHTVGGVISPAEPLLEIVPLNDNLVIEAHLDPKDIDSVRPGLSALVRLTALNQRSTKPVEAKVKSISADSLIDERTGLDYYLAKLELTGNIKESLSGQELYPGMQAEVMIETGSRTPMEYLIQPMNLSINRAFRED